jgi:Acyclic terpene utilisation family protein AtuA
MKPDFVLSIRRDAPGQRSLRGHRGYAIYWYCGAVSLTTARPNAFQCGTACTVIRNRPDSIMAWIRDDHFDIEPMDLDSRCSPRSVASHTMYENGDPFLITEPDGTIDCHGCRYEALNDRAVRVHNSQFIKAGRSTVKLEGAQSVGHQAIIIGGVREPYILRQLDSWLDAMRARFATRVEEIFDGRVGADDYSIHARVHGRDGVMGKLEPLADQIGHEVCIIGCWKRTCRSSNTTRPALSRSQSPAPTSRAI